MNRRRIALERQRRLSQARAVAIPHDTARARTLFWAGLLAMLLMAMLASRAHAESAPVQVSAAAVKAKPGQTATVNVQVKIAKGWHIFGAQPLVDGVKPSALTLGSASGLTVQPITLPAAKKVHVEALKADANVYENLVTVPVKVKIDPKASPGARTLDGELSYQGCSESQCVFPKKVPFKVTLTVAK